jgi:hypothetical protein
VEAFTWCLAQRPCHFSLDGSFLVVVQEAAKLAETDELVWLKGGGSASKERHLSAEGCTRMRVACLEMLVALVGLDEFRKEGATEDVLVRGGAGMAGWCGLGAAVVGLCLGWQGRRGPQRRCW